MEKTGDDNDHVRKVFAYQSILQKNCLIFFANFEKKIHLRRLLNCIHSVSSIIRFELKNFEMKHLLHDLKLQCLQFFSINSD